MISVSEPGDVVASRHHVFAKNGRPGTTPIASYNYYIRDLPFVPFAASLQSKPSDCEVTMTSRIANSAVRDNYNLARTLIWQFGESSNSHQIKFSHMTYIILYAYRLLMALLSYIREAAASLGYPAKAP